MFHLQKWKYTFNLSVLKRFLWTVRTEDNIICINDDRKSEELKFPLVWLRDNCQCSQCFHTVSNSRTIDAEKFDFDVRPVATAVNHSNLEVTWTDKHFSTYSIQWLQEHSFSAELQHLWLETIYRARPVPWKANEFFRVLKVFDFKDVINEKEVLLSWLESLAIWGVAIIQNAGQKAGTLHELGNLVAFLKQTQYGETFDVIAKPGTSNVAYLSGPLQLHTDLPYYEYKPGVNLLHCLVQSSGEGGQSQLADGLAISQALKQNYPEEYKILTSVPVDWSDVVEEGGRHFHSLYRAPVICENSVGEVMRINFSQPQRDSHFNVPLEQAVLWYKAIRHFTHMMHSTEYKISFKMKEGEILAFSNIRLLHGRSTYNGARHIQGGYVDWDHVYSRIRVLKRQTVSHTDVKDHSKHF